MLAAMASCNNGQYAEKIDTVDSLTMIVEKYQVEIDSLQSDTIRKSMKHMHTTVEYLSEHYSDTTNRKLAIENANFMRQLDKAYKRYEEGMQTLQAQSGESLKQLETLRNSLEDAKLTEEEAKKYVQDEAGEVSSIQYNVNKVKSSIEWSREVWTKVGPRFDSLSTYYHSSSAQ